MLALSISDVCLDVCTGPRPSFMPIHAKSCAEIRLNSAKTECSAKAKTENSAEAETETEISAESFYGIFG